MKLALNILLITSEIGKKAGGLALTCWQLENMLQNLNCNVMLEISLNYSMITSLAGGYDKNLGEKIKYSYFLKMLYDRYKDNDVNLIISYGAGKNGYLASLLSKKLNIPYYLVLCGSDVNISFFSNDLFVKNSIAIKGAQKVIGLSEELIENAKIYDNCSDKYMVIPNYYNKQHYFNNLKQLDKDKIVFGSGSNFLSEKKGVSNLLIAFAEYLRNSKRNDVLYLYGKIDNDIELQYKKIILKNDLQKNVFLCGYLQREEYLRVMDSIDVYIQASPFEGCCNAVGEAIMNGKYILISNTGFFAEILRFKFPELVLPSLTIDTLSKSLLEYVNYINKHDVRLEVQEYIDKYVKYSVVEEKWASILSDVRNAKINHEKNILKKTINYVKCVMFHDINNVYSGIDYPKYGFMNLVDLVSRKGYRFCSCKEYLNTDNKDNLIICTFDDAYESVYTNALPIMQKYGFTATVFVCPDLIGKDNSWNHRDDVVRYHMTKEMLDVLYKNKWEIGSHGMSHYNMLRLSQLELEENLLESKLLLENNYGDIITFCYPYGCFKPYIRKMVSTVYEVAFSVDVGGNCLEKDRYQLTRFVPEELKKLLQQG